MYVAYSDVLHDIVNVNDVFDLNEVFRCPNPNCTARFKIRSVTGKPKKHFAKLRRTNHINGCEYENGDNRYLQKGLQKRSTIKEIFQGSQDSNSREGNRINSSPSNCAQNVLRINTPKKLLTFCRMNSLNTEYLTGITVNDIIVDDRNLVEQGFFLGVTGFRIIVCETVKQYHNDILYLESSAISKKGKQLCLHIRVEMSSDLLEYVKKHVIMTNGKFEGYKIAVFGDWKIDKKFNISCKLQNQKHIMLRI